MIFQQKNSLLIQAQCCFALSSWKMRSQRPRVSLRSDTPKNTCHKHVFTYQLAFAFPPVSNGTGLIKPDFMKKKLPPFFSGHFCFDELCSDIAQLSTGKLFIVLVVEDHNGRSKIHHQLLCQIHDETDLLQISLLNDGKIELGIVFGYRLVYPAPIEHKLFLDLYNHELLNWLVWNWYLIWALFVDTLNEHHLQLFFVQHQLFIQSEMLKGDLNEEYVEH